MPSSWTPSLRFEQQFTGENINTWGDRLNAVLSRVDSAIAGWAVIAIVGDYTLTTANGTADEARSGMLKFNNSALAANATITIPAISKSYFIFNNTNKTLTFTTGAGPTVSIDAGDKTIITCDGSAVHTITFGALPLKDFITAFTASAGAVPSPLGNAGKFLHNDGTNVLWRHIAAAEIDFASGFTMAGSIKQNVVAVPALSIDVSTGEFFTKAIGTNSAFAFSGATASKAQAFILDLTISASAVPTWPAAVDWAGGVAPTLPNGRSLLAFVTLDGGMGWVGVVLALSVS